MKHIFLFLAAVLVGALGCGPALDCPDVTDPLVLETEFEPGSPCFADYERTPDLDFEHASTATADVSHNVGRNCQSCHQANGPGLGIFTAAGTIYGPGGEVAPAGTVVALYEDRDRTILVDELPVDQLGNIYTTDDLGLDTAKLFVSVWTPDRAAHNDMGSSKYNLSCNFCHDSTFQVVIDPAGDALP